MANVDSVNGFRELRGSVDEKYHKRFHVNSAYATIITQGMAVKLAGTANADGVGQVEALGAGNTNALGVVVGVETPNWNDLTKNYIPASTGGYVLINTDPRTHYVVQEDSEGGALTSTHVGQLIDLIDAGASANGVAGQEIDSSTVGASGQFRVLGLYQSPDNAIGAQAKWIVTFAEHMDLNTIAAV